MGDDDLLLGSAEATNAKPEFLAVDLVKKAAECLGIIRQGLRQMIVLIIQGHLGLTFFVQATETVVGHADQIGIWIGGLGMAALDDVLEIVGVDSGDDVFGVADRASLEQNILAQAPECLVVEGFELCDGVVLVHGFIITDESIIWINGPL